MVRSLLLLTIGCQAYAAIDDRGRQSGGVAYLELDRCSNAGTKTQTYARYWAVPGMSHAMGVMYASYHPRLQVSETRGEDSMNHKHYWSYYVALSTTRDGKNPYACAFWHLDVWETHSWRYCARNGKVVIKREQDTMTVVNGPSSAPVLQNLVAWEFLKQDQILTFDAADWGPYTVCLMKDVHFNSEMTKLFHFTKRWLEHGGDAW